MRFLAPFKPVTHCLIILFLCGPAHANDWDLVLPGHVDPDTGSTSNIYWQFDPSVGRIWVRMDVIDGKSVLSSGSRTVTYMDINCEMSTLAWEGGSVEEFTDYPPASKVRKLASQYCG